MDVRDPKLLSVFEEFKPSIVFHEAAQTMVTVPQWRTQVMIVMLIY